MDVLQIKSLAALDRGVASVLEVRERVSIVDYEVRIQQHAVIHEGEIQVIHTTPISNFVLEPCVPNSRSDT